MHTQEFGELLFPPLFLFLPRGKGNLGEDEGVRITLGGRRRTRKSCPSPGTEDGPTRSLLLVQRSEGGGLNGSGMSDPGI